MEIPKFTGDEDKDEIDPMELLRLVNKYDRNPLTTRSYFFGESHAWWMSIDFDIRWTSHGKNLKNSSQINGLGIQNGGNV
jgi:hypothetical protein